MELLLLSAADVRAALPMGAAIEVAKAAFAAQQGGTLVSPPRVAVPVEPAGGVTLIMPAHLPGTGLATKVVSVFPRADPQITGLVLVLDEENGAPRALIDGTFLTAWRTAAAVGAATDLLAREDARVAAMLGAGAQGRTHVEALDAARDLEVIRIWSLDRALADGLAAAQAGRVRARLEVAASVDEALEGVDVVSSATPATEPLFPAAALPAGAHLSSVGSFTPEMIEIDPHLTRSARVFVDDESAALEEAGELMRARELGLTRTEDWIPLGEVVLGRAEGRVRSDERTWFKSVGLAVQDVTAAAAVVAAAEREGLGRRVEL